MVLEIKTVPRFVKEDYLQIDAYLKVLKMELGILANFRNADLKYKRVLNPQARPIRED